MVKNKVSNTTVIFAKIPGLGIAKSRIAATHGQQKAGEIYKELLSITSSIIKGINYHISFDGSDDYTALQQLFPQARSFFMQKGDTLGDRLRNAFTHLFDSGYRHVCAIGTDCPTLSKKDLDSTFFFLDDGIDTVIGPSHDGGYYLIACNRKSLDIFSAKQWGEPGLFEETMDILTKQSLSYSLLKPRFDIDYMDDYKAWKESGKI